MAGTEVRINLQATRAPDNFFTKLRIAGLRNTDCFLSFARTKPHGSAAVGAHSSVGQSSGLIIRRSWDHAPLGPHKKGIASKGGPFLFLVCGGGVSDSSLSPFRASRCRSQGRPQRCDHLALRPPALQPPLHYSLLYCGPGVAAPRIAAHGCGP